MQSVRIGATLISQSSRSVMVALFKHILSIRVMVGVGVVAALALPRMISILLAVVLLAPSLVRQAAIQIGVLPETQNRTVRRGRMTAKIEGDFVVFMIGARSNREWAVTSNFKKTGDAFELMVKELNANPELGCLGIENYTGFERGQSTLVSIQYWRTPEHLQKYATSSDNQHYPGWKMLMKLGKASDEIAFWHETFLVKDGQYEAIYVNTPPIHLNTARGVSVLPAQGQYTTMRSRLKMDKGAVSDWDPALQESASY